MPKPSQLTYYADERAGAIAGNLLAWYATNQRDLPWRRSRDPYRIWVSEVMLQQTRVETVMPYYERWMAQFPTPQALAEAPEEQVLKAWEGLGYYSRARNLQQAVQEVVATYDGKVPNDPAAIASLKGVGPYTAGAILSIAYNRPVAAVDGNVMRVFARLFAIADDIGRPATRRAIEALVESFIPEGHASAFNQALMDLGAMVCTPRSPKCLLCPVREQCQALETGRVGELPVKEKAKAPRPVDMVAAALWHDGRLLIARRPPEGLLAGLWGFPGRERPVDLPWERALHASIWEQYGVEIEVEAHLVDVKHVFSHLIWNLRCYTARLAPGQAIAESETVRWVRPQELAQYALPTAHQKIAAAVGMQAVNG